MISEDLINEFNMLLKKQKEVIERLESVEIDKIAITKEGVAFAINSLIELGKMKRELEAMKV